MIRLFNWLGEWVETIRVAPPFSRRRRDLLAAIIEADRDMYDSSQWVEVERPRPGHSCLSGVWCGDGSCSRWTEFPLGTDR